MKTLAVFMMVILAINVSYANDAEINLEAETALGMQDQVTTVATHCGQRFVRELAEETQKNYEKEAFGITE